MKKIFDEYTTNAERQAMDLEKWDKRFMALAEHVSTWSSCIREGRQMGAVITKNKRVLTTGYNGACSGIDNCVDRNECIRNKQGIPSGTRAEICLGVHAEQNAVIQAAKLGVCIDGATLYCTHQPCVICAKIIINSGVTRVVYKNGYPDEFAKQLFKEANVALVQLS